MLSSLFGKGSTNMTIKNALLFVATILLSSCGYTTVPPGYSGIKVNQWGTDKGVSSYPL